MSIKTNRSDDSEHSFNVVESIFNVVECLFNVAERTFSAMRITFYRELPNFYPLPDEFVSVANVIFISDKSKRISVLLHFPSSFCVQTLYPFLPKRPQCGGQTEIKYCRKQFLHTEIIVTFAEDNNN